MFSLLIRKVYQDFVIRPDLSLKIIYAILYYVYLVCTHILLSTLECTPVHFPSIVSLHSVLLFKQYYSDIQYTLLYSLYSLICILLVYSMNIVSTYS